MESVQGERPPSTTMKAGLQTGLRKVELVDFERPALTPDTVIVKVASVGVCGSDLHAYRTFDGRGGFPPGHELAGVVVEVGSDVTTVALGARVTVDMVQGTACGACEYCRAGYAIHCQARALPFGGGFAQYVRTRAQGVYVLPDAVDNTLGAIVEPIAVGVHGMRRMRAGPGMKGLIVGAGTIGLSALAAALDAGCDAVYVAARHPFQAEAAMALGAAGVIPTDLAAAREATSKLTTGGLGFDFAIETVGGTASTLDLASELTRPLGQLVVLGAFDRGFKAIDIIAAHIKELTIHLPNCYSTIDGKHDYEVAIDLLARRGDTLRKIVTHTLPLDEVGNAFRIADDKSEGSIKVQVKVE